MDPPTFGAGFGAIDDAEAPAALLAYLDTWATLDEVRDAKARSYELLGPHAGKRLLDVGCGTGRDVRALAELVGPAGSVVGVDTSEKALAAARAGGDDPRVDFVTGSAESLPFPDCSFDAARSERTIQHLSRPERGLAELFRVLRPGGRVAISEGMNVVTRDGRPLEDEVARALLAGFWNESEDRGWIGWMLPLVLPRSGFERVRVDRQVFATREWSKIEAGLRFGQLVEAAVARGSVGRAEATRWLADLRDAADAGRVTLEMTFLHYVGDVPDR